MTTINKTSRVQDFWKKLNSTTEKIKGTFFGRGIGLNATANFTAEDGMMKKILDGTELHLSLDINLKIDNVTLSAIAIVDNVDKSDFQEQDNVTVCFGKSKDCQKLFDLTFWEALQRLHNTSEGTVSVNNIEAIEFKIKGDEKDLYSLFSKFLYNNDEAFEIKFTVNGHATSDLKFDIELHGNTTIDDIEKLDDDDEIFDGDILNELTQVEGQICIGTECANFIECSDNLCNHHQENKSTTTTTTKPIIPTSTTTTIKPINPAKTTTTKTSTNTTEITTKSTTTTTTIKITTETTTMKNTTEKPKQDKNKTARGFGYFCAVVIIFAIGGLVFYYYRKRRNETMTSRSEYAELTATHI